MSNPSEPSPNTPAPTGSDTLASNLTAAQALFETIKSLGPQIEQAASIIQNALLTGGKLLCCGNGGSAADSAHFTAEIAGRYIRERPGYPAIDLTSNNSLTTALINDYPPQEIFARHVRAVGAKDDVLAGLTTSGNSANVILAFEMAKKRGLHTIAFLGRDGGQCKGLADVEFIIPSDITARIQECHLLLYHTICELVDPALTKNAQAD